MKKTLLTIAATIAITTSAQAKEVHLDCAYSTTEGRSETTKIMLDTDNNTATLYERLFIKDPNWKKDKGKPKKVFVTDTGVGTLYSDPSVYWFTAVGDKFQINRSTLEIIMDGMSPMPKGTCKVIETPAKPENKI